MEPREIKIFKKFEKTLGKMLPVDQPEFIALLEREKIIDEETKKRMNSKRSQDIRADLILEEIEKSLPGREKLDRLFVVMKEYKQKEGLEKLAQEMENHLDPIGTPFECRTMAEYLSNNQHLLFQNISYKPMRRFLVTYSVLTDDEQSEIDQMGSDEKFQMILVINKITNNLYGNQTSKLKSFLKLLEEDDNPNFNETAKRLGGSKRVPADTAQTNKECKDEEALDDIESGTVGNFRELYAQAVNDLGSEELQLCKVVFFGPPGVGKTSLCKVLIKSTDTKQESEQSSTDILDIKLVQFTVEVTKDEKEGKSVWNVVTLEKEIKRLHRIIEKRLHNRENPNELQQESYNKVQQKHPPLEDVSLPIVEKNESIHEMICDCLPEPPTIEKQKTYQKTSNFFIALYDSGGQPEFFDVMPLLNTLPTGNVMVFNLNESLNAKISPELYEKGCRMFTGKETHYTNAELMKTALANIESCITKRSVSGHKKVLVVGTHLDEYVVGKENIEESLSQLDDTLCKAVLSDSTRSMLVYYSREGEEDRIVHPISNINFDKQQNEVAQKIRTAIEGMCKIANTKTKIPNSWLLFQYQIRLLKKPCISLRDCQNIADRVYIKEDVKVVLMYFHDLGILLNYKELDDVVFCDPQWLFKQLSTLIRAKYNKSFSPDMENGIVTIKFLAKNIYPSLEKDTEEILKLKDLLKLFTSLYIIAKLPDKDSENFLGEEPEERYFMPALLSPAPQNLSLSEFGKAFYDTMYVMFKGTLFPRGMFCCLVALLTKKQNTFKILENNMHKNLIIFQKVTDESQNYVILSDKINHMTVELYQQNEYNLLHEIYCELAEALQEVCRRMRLNYQFQFGFACREKSCQEKNSKKDTATVAIVDLRHSCCPKIMSCTGCSKSVTLSYNQLLWFVPLKALDVLQSEDSMQPNVKRKHEVDEPSDIESESSVKSKKPKKEELVDPSEHHHKMTHMEVYEKYANKLVKGLSMDDVTFTTQLSSNNLLPDSVDAHIKSLPTPCEKADYFLKHVIKPSLDIEDTEELDNLITVMDKCGYPHIKRLASKMKLDLIE